jgi:hypothetical protein
VSAAGVRHAYERSEGSGPGGGGETALSPEPRDRPVTRAPTPRKKRSFFRGYAPWHFLNFLPLPHQQGSFRPSFSCGEA